MTFVANAQPREKTRSPRPQSGFNSLIRLLTHVSEFLEENNLQDGAAAAKRGSTAAR